MNTTHSVTLEKKLKLIAENQPIQRYYMEQVYLKVETLVWNVYFRENPNAELPSKKSLKGKLFNEIAEGITGIPSEELVVLKKPRGNSEVVIRLLCFFVKENIKYEDIFFDEHLIAKCYSLVTE